MRAIASGHAQARQTLHPPGDRDIVFDFTGKVTHFVALQLVTEIQSIGLKNIQIGIYRVEVKCVAHSNYGLTNAVFHSSKGAKNHSKQVIKGH